MKEEMKALRSNNIWILTNLPTRKKIAGCKWVYSIEYKLSGQVETLKVSWLQKTTPKHEVDFRETFFPVAKLNSITILLSLLANFDWPLL